MDDVGSNPAASMVGGQYCCWGIPRAHLPTGCEARNQASTTRAAMTKPRRCPHRAAPTSFRAPPVGLFAEAAAEATRYRIPPLQRALVPRRGMPDSLSLSLSTRGRHRRKLDTLSACKPEGSSDLLPQQWPFAIIRSRNPALACRYVTRSKTGSPFRLKTNWRGVRLAAPGPILCTQGRGGPEAMR